MAFTNQQLLALQRLMNQQEQHDDLLSFRAGRMMMDENNIVTAQPHRGKIKFYKSEEGLLHLEWRNRLTNASDLDIILFPNCAKWQKIEQCKDGRVYLLKFMDSNRREFFWMQEPSNEKDQETEQHINKLLSA